VDVVVVMEEDVQDVLGVQVQDVMDVDVVLLEVVEDMAVADEIY
jgi:hypothetical protein